MASPKRVEWSAGVLLTKIVDHPELVLYRLHLRKILMHLGGGMVNGEVRVSCPSFNMLEYRDLSSGGGLAAVGT